jgi:hypothetical protein
MDFGMQYMISGDMETYILFEDVQEKIMHFSYAGKCFILPHTNSRKPCHIQGHFGLFHHILLFSESELRQLAKRLQ